MKIRSQEELVDYLAANLQRRKHELVSVGQNLPPHVAKPLPLWLRVSVVLSYAHWEGFVKDAATAYVSFVGRKAVSLNSLRPCFQAIVCRPDIIAAFGATKKIAPHLKIIDRLVDGISVSVSVPSESVIDTESNLTWAVFENVLTVIGMEDSTHWSPYRGIMDDMFLARCAVAHGQMEVPDPKVAALYHSFVVDALDQFSTDVVNAAHLYRYLRSPPTASHVPEVGRLAKRPNPN